MAANPPPSRPWQVIARELAGEVNRDRVTELSEELNRALEEQEHAIKPEPQSKVS